MVYLIREADVPNSAPENRFLGLAKGLKACGLEFQIVILISQPTLYQNPDFQEFNIRYLWNTISVRNHKIRRIWHYLWSRWLCRFTFRSFCKSLKNDDCVLVFEGKDYIHKFLQIPGVKVYMERTEHPEVVSRFKTEKKMLQYLEDTKKLEGIFVISTALKRYFESVGVSPNRIHIVNMTVEASRFKGIEKQFIKEHYIAYCGTIQNHKDGVDYLLRSFALVARRIPNVKLYVIGKTPLLKDKESNMRLIYNLGIADRVVFTGMIPASEMPQVLANAEVCALARPNSLQAENGFPTKLGEYLLSKNPVVITRTGDIPLFLEDGKSALLCEERDVEEFADKLCWVFEHPTEARQIGLMGEQVALKYFNSLAESKKIFNLIKDC